MEAMESAQALARDIKASEEYKIYAQYKQEVEEDDTLKALLKEFQRLQVRTQLTVVSGGQADPEETSRFTQLTSLLFADPRTSGYLMAQMKLQKMMADIFAVLTQAADLPMELPQ